jgi:hypothetical protein
MKDRLFAKVINSNNANQDNIKWLEICPSEDGSVYVFQFEDLSCHCRYDEWFQKTEDALEWAEEQYGIRQSDWLSIEDLHEMGIVDISEDR